MLFWILAGLLTCLSLGAVLLPLLRGGPAAAARARYDMQVYRDQLSEVEGDLGRGVLTESEAAASRVEISRRLLHAADDAEAETGAAAAPRRASRAMAALAGLAGIGLAGAIYAGIGAEGLPDQPLAARRLAEAEAHANRPGQAEVEAMIAASTEAEARPPAPEADTAMVEQLETVLEGRADDVEGHRLLARSLGALGRFGEARAAQARVVTLMGEEATGADHAALAELMILAANGYVSPEAEAALGAALERAPADPLARYYSGLALIQGNRPDLAYRIWSGLLAEGPEDAPWIAPIRADIGAVAAAAGLPPPEGAGAAPDAAMIEGMVSGLGERLAREGGPPADWARLIRSLGVLGRGEEAARIWREAEAVFADDAEGLAAVAEAAREAGVAAGMAE